MPEFCVPGDWQWAIGSGQPPCSPVLDRTSSLLKLPATHDEKHLMRSLGKALQMFALVVLPLAMLMEATDMLGRRTGVSDMVVMMVAGVAAFVLGRLIEGYAAG